MVISDIDKAVFFHIPKNGGSSLRNHLLATWTAPREFQGRKFINIEKRIVDLTHITPSEAITFFHEDPCSLGYTAYVVSREPISRFKSALAQHIKSFHQKKRHHASVSEIEKYLRKTNAEDLCLRAESDYSCVYFRRQSDYIGEGIFTVVALESVNTFFSLIDDTHSNVTGNTPRWASVLNITPLKIVYHVLSPALKNRIKTALIKRDQNVDVLIAKFTAENEFFLRDYYTDDFKFHKDSIKC